MVCQHSDCSAQIAPERGPYCLRHKKAAQKRNKKARKSGLFTSDGRVAVGMGMQRLREADRKKWIRREAQRKEEEKILREMNS